MPAALTVHLVRKVGGVHERFVAHHLDRSGKQRLTAFAADKNTSLLDVPDDVVTDFLAGFEREVAASRIVHDVCRIGAVEAFDTEEKPGNAAFQKTESNIWKLFQNAIENN